MREGFKKSSLSSKIIRVVQSTMTKTKSQRYCRLTVSSFKTLSQDKKDANHNNDNDHNIHVSLLP